MRRGLWLGTLALGAAVAISSGAMAHMVLVQGEAPAGSYYKAVFGNGHGCSGSPTIRVRILVPEGVTNVKPQPKPGWTLETVKKTYKTPIVDHGRTITEGVGEVIWSGGKLLDAHYDEFVMQVKLPETAGATVYFPAVQECEQGVHRWIEIPERVVLPLSREPPKVSRIGTRSHRRRVLLVDDDPMVLDVAREYLTLADFDVATRKTACAALALYQDRRPDLVLLDILMPDVDGYAVCTRIRNLPDGEMTPILMVTGLNDTNSINRAYEVGATDFIAKPINWTNLNHHISYVIRNSRVAEELRRSEVGPAGQRGTLRPGRPGSQ